ncbi:hypothetical protein BV25DRAFT_1762895, partial [Artomyces pyxidatus]
PRPTMSSSSSLSKSSRLYDVPLLEEDGGNFAFWKFRVQMVLEIRELWPIVSGMELMP